MLTDFTNIKFTNTHGSLEGMKLNEPTVDSIIDIVTTLPSGGSDGDRYIYAPCSGHEEHQDNIVTYQLRTDSTSVMDGTSIVVIDSTSIIHTYEDPLADSIAYVTNQGENYIYSERGWIPLPDYTIPLEIDIEVVKTSTYSGTITALMTTVRETIYNAFKDRFGTNAEIYRSEIIDVVQDIDGVSHCRLRKPETSIFFNFELINLTEEQLLRYGPEYVYFDEDSITVRVS
jgi:hypothetical protein